MDKRSLSERDICAKFITSALGQARWEAVDQFRASSGLKAQEFASRIPRIN
jgi:type I site-specific restriction endonuclease